MSNTFQNTMNIVCCDWIYSMKNEHYVNLCTGFVTDNIKMMTTTPMPCEKKKKTRNCCHCILHSLMSLWINETHGMYGSCQLKHMLFACNIIPFHYSHYCSTYWLTSARKHSINVYHFQYQLLLFNFFNSTTNFRARKICISQNTFGLYQ